MITIYDIKVKLRKKTNSATIKEIARDIGVSKSALSRFLNGWVHPKNETMELYQNYLGYEREKKYTLIDFEEKDIYEFSSLEKVKDHIKHWDLPTKEIISLFDDGILRLFKVSKELWPIVGQIDFEEKK